MNRRGFFAFFAAPFLARLLPKPKPLTYEVGGYSIDLSGFDVVGVEPLPPNVWRHMSQTITLDPKMIACAEQMDVVLAIEREERMEYLSSVLWGDRDPRRSPPS